MKPDDIGLIALPQIGGGPAKLRPALLLSTLPGPYQNMLLCGISSHLHDIVADWDELLDASEQGFAATGLHQSSVVRLSYLYSGSSSEIVGVIGSIDSARLDRISNSLAGHLRK